MFAFIKKAKDRMKDYGHKALALLVSALENDKKLEREDHFRNVEIAFSFTTESPVGEVLTTDRIITIPTFFDKGFKIKSQDGNTPYNLMSLRVLDGLSITPDNLEMFDKPTKDYNIKLIDGHQLEVLGRCTAKWWGKDKPCTKQEIWLDNNFMKSEFLIISPKALHAIVITWDTMVEEGLLHPTTSCAGGLGGHHPKPPLPSSEEEKKRKKADQLARQAQERAAQDKKDKEARKGGKKEKEARKTSKRKT